jgi:O-antigen/teichoic acid export membrane protein
VKKSFILFFVFGVVARLFPLLLIPFITRVGDDAVVAEFMLFVSISAFCCMFYLFGTQFELTRVFFAARERVSINITNAMLLVFLFGVMGTAFIFFMGLDDIYILASINGCFTAVVSYALVYFRVSGLVLKFGVTDVLRVAVQYVIMGALLHFYQFDLLLILISNLVWITGLFIYEFFKTRVTVKSMVESIDKAELRDNLVRGCAILPHSISIYALALLDKILLSEMASVTVLAQYSVGFVFGQTVLLVTDSFNKVWGPYAVKTIEEGDRGRVVRASIVISIFAIVLAPFVGVVVYFVSKIYFPLNYFLAIDVAVLVSLIYVIQSIYFVVFPFLVQSGEVGRIGVITTVSAIAGAMVMFLLAYWGYYTYLPIGMLVAFCGQIMGIVFTVRKFV